MLPLSADPMTCIQMNVQNIKDDYRKDKEKLRENNKSETEQMYLCAEIEKFLDYAFYLTNGRTLKKRILPWSSPIGLSIAVCPEYRELILGMYKILLPPGKRLDFNFDTKHRVNLFVFRRSEYIIESSMDMVIMKANALKREPWVRTPRKTRFVENASVIINIAKSFNIPPLKFSCVNYDINPSELLKSVSSRESIKIVNKIRENTVIISGYAFYKKGKKLYVMSGCYEEVSEGVFNIGYENQKLEDLYIDKDLQLLNRTISVPRGGVISKDARAPQRTREDNKWLESNKLERVQS